MDKKAVNAKFFAFRNGVVARNFHEAGAPYPRIFGLQLPQIGEIARETGYDDLLGRELWSDRDCRESRLLACYLLNPETLQADEALSLARDVQTREEADVLAWRLLRKLPFARQLATRLDGYMKQALERNLQ